MLLSMNTNNRKNASVKVQYLIHIQEIKPWPPSQSLRSLRSVLIQWDNGDRHSGSTNIAVPSIGSVGGEGKIEFNESFRLPVTLQRDNSSRGKDTDGFRKNCLEFNLYEPRRDKTQLLATAVIDLADYGILKEAISISAPMNSKRSLTNTYQPVLYIKMQPVEKRRTTSSSRGSLSRGLSMDKNGAGSVSLLMNEEYAEEAESASFTDDDVSSHSSLANGILPHPSEVGGLDRMTQNNEIKVGYVTNSRSENEKLIASPDDLKRCSSRSSSTDLSSDLGSPVNGHTSPLDSPDSNSMSISNIENACNIHSFSSIANGNKEVEVSASKGGNGLQDLKQEFQEEVPNSTTKIKSVTQQSCKENSSGPLPEELATLHNESERSKKVGSSRSRDSVVNEKDIDETQTTSRESSVEVSTMDNAHASSMEDMISRSMEEKRHLSEDQGIGNFPEDDARNDGLLKNDAHLPSVAVGIEGNNIKADKLKHVKSVRSPSESVWGNGLVRRNHISKMEEVGSFGDALNRTGSLRVNERIHPPNSRNTILDSKIHQLEHKIKMLEGELIEAAAVEAALYSVVAEHGSSMSKVHAPARRLSRLYLHACKGDSQLRRASAARSAVSGIVLVAKACGNDVPRLTFWLSNSVVLRAIVSQAIDNTGLPLPSTARAEINGGEKGYNNISSPLKWKELSSSWNENKFVNEFGDWGHPRTFMSALEKVEAWIFSRTVESIWWQTLTPHMQSAATKAIHTSLGSSSKKQLGKTSCLGDQDQQNISLDLWKFAFEDACERLCPVRGGGHECGCLPMLARLIMEQCVARLDVAMLNAILRESADEIPTDPVSDPISDSKVLPIPSGKSSFGAGAQLKSVIGNWSRWLTDLFGMDDDDSRNDDDEDENDETTATSFKSFHLLNALSDLMMLPKDMLLSKSIRKEVCPTFGTPLIKRVLDNFVVDEFCPDPIPDAVLEALNSEDFLEAGDESISTTPCAAAPPIYLPPSTASVAGIVGDFSCQSHLRRSGSSVLRKSYTSDDELDELNSPLAAIIHEGSLFSPTPRKTSWKSKEKGNRSSIRYELLREIWMNSE